MIDQEFVKYIVSSLVSKPDEVKVERVVDERGVLLTLHVDEEDLGRVIGRKGSTAQSLRVLLRALGSKNEAHYNLRIADDKNRRSFPAATPSTPDTPSASDSSTEDSRTSEDSNSFASNGIGGSDFAQDETPVEEKAEKAEDDSLLDKTKKELDSLNDLDI